MACRKLNALMHHRGYIGKVCDSTAYSPTETYIAETSWRKSSVIANWHILLPDTAACSRMLSTSLQIRRHAEWKLFESAQ